MSPQQRVQWCESKLIRIAELERVMDQNRGAAEYDEAMRNFAQARYDITNALSALRGVPMPAEYLTLWGRLNRWVNDWADADRRREEARRTNSACHTCSGRGVTIEGSYRFYFATCRDCGGTGRVRSWRGY